MTGAVARAAALAGDDREAGLAGRGDVLDRHAADVGQRRRVGAQPLDEGRDGLGRALGLDEHAALVVEDPARDAELVGEPVDEGPVAHALHGAVDAGADAPRGALRLLCHVAASGPASSTSSRSTW